MKHQNFVFRSKSEREKEIDLLSQYRQIGIAAIAAAASCRKQGANDSRPAPKLFVEAHD